MSACWCKNIIPLSPLSQDVAWFLKAMIRLVQEEMSVASVPQEPYFVDFLREAPEPTGEEPEDADLEAPKVYEQVGASISVECTTTSATT